MVGFSGWEMPVQYGGILEEHRAVREGCGVFDISHMGEFVVRGERACAWLDEVLTNRVASLETGKGQYTLMCNEQGGVIDDLILYRSGEQEFFLVVNAAKVEEDRAWLRGRLVDGVEFVDESGATAAMAVQGPGVVDVWQEVVGERLPERNATLRGEGWRVCRTGYSGEDGFEFFCDAGVAQDWWARFVEAGAVPCGLGARDSLRLEMCYPLNGSDLSPERTPIEAGLGFFVDLGKNFCGAEVLRRQKERGLRERLVALRMIVKGPPPRPHYAIYVAGEQVGELTSGGQSPSLGCGIGMGYLPVGLAKVGTLVEIDVRGRRFGAEVVKKPIYRKGEDA